MVFTVCCWGVLLLLWLLLLLGLLWLLWLLWLWLGGAVKLKGGTNTAAALISLKPGLKRAYGAVATLALPMPGQAGEVNKLEQNCAKL